MSFDIAIVIPVFNESQRIEKTLSSFAKEADERILFVIVDNASTDTTAQTVKHWQKKNSRQPLILLYENRKGSLYARTKGLRYAKGTSRIVVSTDADCWPLRGFYNNIRRNFLDNVAADVLKGYERHEPSVRLLKQLYIPELMALIAWQEKIESLLFGPFFFGGYFGIKNDKINNVVFSTHKLPIPKEPSVFWGRHCYYLGYRFILSNPDMRTSSRRFWLDTYNFISGKRSKPIRNEPRAADKQLKKLEYLKKTQNKLIVLRKNYFAPRLLMFLLDAVCFERKISNKTIVASTIERACNFLGVNPTEIRSLADMQLREAKKTMLDRYEQKTYQRIEKQYRTENNMVNRQTVVRSHGKKTYFI